MILHYSPHSIYIIISRGDYFSLIRIHIRNVSSYFENRIIMIVIIIIIVVVVIIIIISIF